MKSDLKTVSVYNVICKYADDIYVLVPEHTDTDLSEEFNHIRQWASKTKWYLTVLKLKILFSGAPVLSASISHHLLMVLSRLNCLNVSVLFSSIVWVLSRILFRYSNSAVRGFICSRCCVSQGIPPAKLHIIFRAIVVSRILYALPAWGTHLLSSQSGRIDAFFKRAYTYRCGLAGELFAVDDLFYSSATGLFKKMLHSTHCLNHLLPPIKSMDYVLRNSGQSYILPHCNYQFHKNSFINWCLFS